MKKITKHPYQFDDTSINLLMPFQFMYGPNELEDGSEIEIIPINNAGVQFSKSVIRTVVLTNRIEDSSYHWYEARIPYTP